MIFLVVKIFLYSSVYSCHLFLISSASVRSIPFLSLIIPILMQSSTEEQGEITKPYLSDHCKGRDENNRIGKTRDLFKKIRDTNGTFHAKMGTIKDRNGMDLTEGEILRRGGKNTQKNYAKKIFTTQLITMV